LFTNQRFNHSISKNDMVQIDYLVMLASPNRLVQIDKVIFFMCVIMGILKQKNPNKKKHDF
jgi:hypothetical protein